MPLYEYICKECGKKSEFLVRNSSERFACTCGSRELKRIISTFAVAEGSKKEAGGCTDSSCRLPSSPCASGMCGI
jgi:putative FmdB family regulatory protein